MTIEERIQALAEREYPITGICIRERTAKEGMRRLRYRRLVEQLEGLTEEQKLFTVEQWEKK